MDTTDALQKNILDATLRVFDRKGLKFTMDDLAKELSISKKTIYTVYDDKEALFLAMVDYIFDSIKESEQMILTDPTLGTIEKLQRILGVLPEGYQNIDLRKLYSLRDKSLRDRLGAYDPADRDRHGRGQYPPGSHLSCENDAGSLH